MDSRAREGVAYGNLGCAYFSKGDYAKAIEYHTQDLSIAKEVGDRAGEGAAYGNLGHAYESQGDFTKAIECLAQDLAIAKEVSDRAGGGHGIQESRLLPHALERVRQSRRLLRSTT